MSATSGHIFYTGLPRHARNDIILLIGALIQETTPSYGHPSTKSPTKFINFAGPDGGEFSSQQEHTEFSSCGGVPRSGEVVFYFSRVGHIFDVMPASTAAQQ